MTLPFTGYEYYLRDPPLTTREFFYMTLPKDDSKYQYDPRVG